MKAFKSAHADVKEKAQNVAAKVGENSALSKASATAKAERKEADNKAGKHEAKANYHTKQAEILREYEQKKENNAAEKEQTKTALNQKAADKLTNKADKHANATGAIVGDGKTDDNVEQTTSTPAATSAETPAAAPAGPTQEELDARHTSTPASPQIPESAPEAPEQDMNATNSTDAAVSDQVDQSQVPIHGSGVPTHSDLHSEANPGSDRNDAIATKTMGGSPNTGSYM